MRKKRKPEPGVKPPLSVREMLGWADEHYRRTGRYPNRDSGVVRGALRESWSAIDAALFRGHRGLPKGGSFIKLLPEHRGYRRRNYLPRLKVKDVLAWADAHRRRTGRLPARASGAILEAPGETWNAIDLALARGTRGLRGGTSLADLLARYRGKAHPQHRPDLTTDQIVAWAEAHRTLYGVLPTTYAGPVGSTGETWLGIDKALREGSRGLPGGSSLYRLFKQEGKVTGNCTPFRRC